MNIKKALVLFSGGQDSATCLAWALKNFDSVETIGFDYGQRHRIELDVRKEFIAGIHQLFPYWSAKLGEDTIVDMAGLTEIGKSSLTEDVVIQMDSDGLPNTFVPGRNILFFTYAAALAYRRGCKYLVGGMCETDYSGYPDCRDDTLKALQATLNLGMNTRLVVHTPLMWIDKAETWSMARHLGGVSLIELIIKKTHTCYIGDREKFNEWGYGCNNCPACDLRKSGWLAFNS